MHYNGRSQGSGSISTPRSVLLGLACAQQCNGHAIISNPASANASVWFSVVSLNGVTFFFQLLAAECHYRCLLSSSAELLSIPHYMINHQKYSSVIKFSTRAERGWLIERGRKKADQFRGNIMNHCSPFSQVLGREDKNLERAWFLIFIF